MKINSCSAWIAAAVLTSVAGPPVAAQVVPDDVCPKYGVDIAAFATSDRDRVAQIHERNTGADAQAIPPAKRSHSALHLSAREAHALIHDPAVRAVLVDVRSSIEVALTGQPVPVHFHVAYQEPVLPPRWDGGRQTWSMASNPYFGEQLMTRLAARGIGPESAVILICSSGERSARAADELADLGYARVITVVDGFEGDFGVDDRRSVNGWKNAGLPWTARVGAALAVSH